VALLLLILDQTSRMKRAQARAVAAHDVAVALAQVAQAGILIQK
jgi:hypothetical protein